MTLYKEKFPYTPHEVEGTQYVGEAILELTFNLGDPKLYDLVGLEPDNWQIVGIHVWPTNARLEDSQAVVLAIDKNTADTESVQPGGLVGKKAVDVVKFTASLKFEDILSTMKRSSIFYKSTGLKDADFYVTDERELPAQK